MDPTQLDRIEGLLAAIKVMLEVKGTPAPLAASAPSGAVADAADLDGKYGDPLVRMNIPAFKWSGPQYKGQNMSAVQDADFLDAYALQLEWSAENDVKNQKTYTDKKTGEEKLSDGKLARADAKRARGWAARVRAKPSRPAKQIDADPFSDDREGGPIF